MGFFSAGGGGVGVGGRVAGYNSVHNSRPLTQGQKFLRCLNGKHFRIVLQVRAKENKRSLPSLLLPPCTFKSRHPSLVGLQLSLTATLPGLHRALLQLSGGRG